MMLDKEAVISLPLPTRLAHVIAAIAGIAICVAAFFPWVTFETGIVSTSWSSADLVGIQLPIAGLLALLVVGFSAAGKSWGTIYMLILGVIVTVFGVFDWIDVGSIAGLSVGSGMVLETLGGAVLASTGYWLLEKKCETRCPLGNACECEARAASASASVQPTGLK